MSESAPPVSTEAPAGDAGLDATHTGDRAYLHELGYRQELRRALGFFSSFAVQWTCIAVAGGLALSMGAGTIQVGGAFFFAWLLGGGLQLIVGPLSTVLNLTAVKIAAWFNNSVGVAAEFIAIAIVIIGVLVAVIFTSAHFSSVSVLTSTDGILAHGQSKFWPFLFALLVPVFVISGFDVNG